MSDSDDQKRLRKGKKIKGGLASFTKLVEKDWKEERAKLDESDPAKYAFTKAIVQELFKKTFEQIEETQFNDAVFEKYWEKTFRL